MEDQGDLEQTRSQTSWIVEAKMGQILVRSSLVAIILLSGWTVTVELQSREMPSAPASEPVGEMNRRTNLSHHHESSVVIIGFVGREGSSWLQSSLDFTQKLSREGKICAMGFEPLDHVNRSMTMNNSRLRQGREKFYSELETLENASLGEWNRWVERLNTILGQHGFLTLNLSHCDFRSKVFLFKARLGIHFRIGEGETAENSIALQNIGANFRKSRTRIILLSRRNILQRSVTQNSGQFRMQKARSEETRKEILKENAQVGVDLNAITQDMEAYLRQSSRTQEVVRRFGVPSLMVSYENLLTNFEDEMSALLRFIEVPIDYDVRLLATRGEFEKVSPTRLCQKVRDYRNFCSYFRDTQYGGYLDEPCDTNCSK